MAEIKEVYKIIEEEVDYYKKRAEKKEKGELDMVPETMHTLVYDSSVETLEPIYFYLLDLMNEFGLDPQKYVDNFTSSPGSPHFGEMGQRASIMQQQATQTLGSINTVLKSILNILYDLKDFKIRLQHYQDLNSKDSELKKSAILSLKQIWLDKVDMPARGNSSIKALTIQGGFNTLLQAFLAADSLDSIKDIDLGEHVKRILYPRVQEFTIWMKESEKELQKRYDIEKTYLRSQVGSLKLYARWAKPYLRAALQLEQKDVGRSPALVRVFNTIILELTLLGKSKVKLPAEFGDYKPKRDYYKCVLLDFKFRGIPQRTQNGSFSFMGRAEVTFRGYALNKDELKKIDDVVDASDIGDVIKIVETTTGQNMETLQKEIDSFLEEDAPLVKPKEEKKVEEEEPMIFSALFGKTAKDSGPNPFKALFGFGKSSSSGDSKEKDSKKTDVKLSKYDEWVEKEFLRKDAGTGAQETTFSLFDIFKKTHGMSSYT